MHESLGVNGDIWSLHVEPEIYDFPRLPIIPKTELYARVPFHEAFDVPEVLRMAAAVGSLPNNQSMYLVDFVSKTKPDADLYHLEELDNAAHLEASNAEGFLLYFRGDLDPAGYNRSFCVWRNMMDAKYASGLPAHAKAARSADKMYDFYRVTMREAWLQPSGGGFSFGEELSHTVGSDSLIY